MHLCLQYTNDCLFALFQWADPVSLGLVHTVLSDMKGESCVLFVGSYRDNEVKPDHILFGFYEKLSAFNVPLNTIHLDGMPEEDVNTMISDAMGMLPRLCRSLSQLVFRKTNGNPFFVKVSCGLQLLFVLVTLLSHLIVVDCTIFTFNADFPPLPG
jgi:hypothetical protein